MPKSLGPLAFPLAVREAPALERLLRREVLEAGVATCAAVAWARLSDGGGLVAVGEVAEASVSMPAVYDLASLTKPVTATAIARAVAEGSLSFDDQVGALLPELATSAASSATIRQLMSHRAGLPAWGVLYREDPWGVGAPRSVAPDGSACTRSDMLRRAASRRSEEARELYSDLGYVLLGEIVTRVTGRSLAHFWAELGLSDAPTRRALDPAVVARMPPTELVDWRGAVRGEVHDENAAMLERAGGTPGHAGAFGSVLDVATFGLRVLRALSGHEPWLPADVAARMIEPLRGGSHTLGWDLRSGTSPSSGARFGPRTFGHLGFTGTSLWVDPDASVVAVLLTNRTWPSRDNVGIRAARPRVHDALWALGL